MRLSDWLITVVTPFTTNPSTLMDFLLGFMDLENISYIFNVQVLACGAPESLLAGYSSLRALAFWLQVQMLYH